MDHKINTDLITNLYNQRQSGFPRAHLRTNGVRFYKEIGGNTLICRMTFAIPGFDDFGHDPVMSNGTQLKGVHLSSASAPPLSELIINVANNDRAVDMQIIQLAYVCGACDLSRYQWPDRLEWFFKPSCHAAFKDFDCRLADKTVDNDGFRLGGHHGLFPYRFYDDFSETDCYQHIYKFGSCKIIKNKIISEAHQQ